MTTIPLVSTILQCLEWDEDLCNFRLTPSVLSSMTHAEGNTSSLALLNGSNRTLLRHTLGFTLITHVHRDLCRELQETEAVQPQSLLASGEFQPVLCTSISFDGFMMNNLHQNLLRSMNADLRGKIMSSHFVVLKMLMAALPLALTQKMQWLKLVSRPAQIFVYLFSAVQYPLWKFFNCPLLWIAFAVVFWVVVGTITPRLIRHAAGFFLRKKLSRMRKDWISSVSSEPVLFKTSA